ncbi:Aldehyde Dehydrogenase [Pseudarthrobacter chlorophenolicus A6]|uniref:Aldehyde Dehydrogenase n=1 Tax=Pseudarthrobacter chlorophenolicus (strain ATCC 700700 / DSM 12829 / CIP 107037 / JCM 12360 / KCTC 9906 / NCIMB 13794 / A6) TaxID=452863 RepID=B8HGK0_PSECP|nr:aldehyde dehydrogenase family protein [Pseudarthrobacter chlorophenolicus]ACL41266.1 Aldehyde Dehydrogenase [Pseudarthrobacter chlorophenolicus A6]SDQ67326.1 aldehyde dehydrogenase (NAD+) [Pseudarthrobacter chlorophenolicus]
MTSTVVDTETNQSADSREAITARHLINGQWLGEADTERMNPARPSEIAAVSPSGTAANVDAAVTAAAAAQPAWAALPAPSRGAILIAAGNLLIDRQSAIAEDLVREEGKTLAEAKGEVKRASDVLRFFGSLGWAATGEVLPSGLPDTTITTRREPLGVVGLITPWNFPIAIPAWKAAPALISGNAVVIKPAELTPLSATHLAQALQDAGLPAGVFNVVHGKGRVVGEALARDARIAGLSFTGSTRVGLGLQEILNARRARVQLEMGGKNGVLVLDDADPAEAAQVVAAGAFGLTGQACTATSRVYVTPGVKEKFLEALVAEAAQYTTGDGAGTGGTSRMGAVVSRQQFEQDQEAVRAAVERGATLLHGRYDGDPSGALFFPAAVLTDLPTDDPAVTEEIFGPVVAVLEVPDYEAGLAAINDSRYGLTAGICTDSLALATDFASRAQAGVVKVNRPTAGLDLNVPFGGVKDSSTNTFREQGRSALDFFTWGKTVYTGI